MMKEHFEKVGRKWLQEAQSIAARLASEPDCTWIVIVLRAERVLTHETRTTTEKALRLALDEVRRTVNQRLGRDEKQVLRFFPCIGGGSETLAHIHALIELPPGMARDNLKDLLEKWWRYFLKKGHDFAVEASVWIETDETRETNLPSAVTYFVRFEGITFSDGSEKVMWECVRLTPSV